MLDTLPREETCPEAKSSLVDLSTGEYRPSPRPRWPWRRQVLENGRIAGQKFVLALMTSHKVVGSVACGNGRQVFEGQPYPVLT